VDGDAYAFVHEMHDSMDQYRCADLAAFERADYMQVRNRFLS
jgi:hypothetical protein